MLSLVRILLLSVTIIPFRGNTQTDTIIFSKGTAPEVYTWTPVTNALDSSGKRTGYWKILGKLAQKPGYKPEEVVEEGMYAHGLKTGLWKEYYPGGKLKKEITYDKNRAHGPARIYWENGCLREEGNWKRARWQGKYLLYYEQCGCLKYEFNYNEAGKRHGEQKYYYPDCSVLQMRGMMNEGKEAGAWVEYDKDGQVKNVTLYAGKLPADIDTAFLPETDSIAYANGYYEPTGSFTGTGYAKIYNSCKFLLMDGYFHGYRLIEGKQYVYDPQCNLIRIGIYELGVYTGDLPKDDPLFKAIPMKKDSTPPPKPPPQPPQPWPPFTGNGYYKLYNKCRSISKEGVFKNYKLIDGKDYIYDHNCLLLKINVYKDGKLAGEAPLPDEGNYPQQISEYSEKIKKDSTNSAWIYELKKQHEQYRKNHPLSWKKMRFIDGEFRDDVLVNGKLFIYDKNGILFRIAIFKGGKYTGNAPVEE